MNSKPGSFSVLAVGLYALLAGTTAPSASAAEQHFPERQKGILHIELELTGKRIHRIETFDIRLQSKETSSINELAKELDEDWVEAGKPMARYAQESEQRSAATQASNPTAELKAACGGADQIVETPACIAAQQKAMRWANEMISGGAPAPEPVIVRNDRYQNWQALGEAGMNGCGTVDAKVLDPGARPLVQHWPSTTDTMTSMIETCIHAVTIDQRKNLVWIYIPHTQVRMPNSATRIGDYCIETGDLKNGPGARIQGDMFFLDAQKATVGGNRFSGSTRLTSSRGVTEVRWTFTRQ